jgi:hypothetical protein
MQPDLRKPYISAKCCRPHPDDPIVGYYSHDNVIKVHKDGCASLVKITASRDADPGEDIPELTELDYRILAHHEQFGVDYSLKVAGMLHVAKQDVFDRHRALRELGLLTRVEPTMIRYRKGIVKNKWIKHRNHTYYELTEKGRACLARAEAEGLFGSSEGLP